MSKQRLEPHMLNALHTRLSGAARTESDFVYYSEIIQMSNIGHLSGPPLREALGEVLFEVNEYDRKQDVDRPMLSAIAVSNEMRPGDGFYRLAREYKKLSSDSEADELPFWFAELEDLRTYWQSHANTSFKGNEISFSAVEEALLEFDAQYPDSSDYDGWIDHEGYKYALEYGGRFYPPKHILSVVSGVDVSQFSGGSPTNRVFLELGLFIVDKPDAPAPTPPVSHMTYLLTWNPTKSEWVSFQEDWENVYLGNRPRIVWSCGNTRRIRVGDRVFMMQLGQRQKVSGIFASGWVTKEPTVGAHWADIDRNALYVEFEPDILLNSQADQLLDPNLIAQQFNWHPQSSGVTIPEVIAVKLEGAWHRHTQHLEPEHLTDAKTNYVEGGKTLTISYRYERDPRARQQCIASHGARCAVCGFDFQESFGDLGAGFIHVHHLTPLSERDAEYAVDPVNDLSPVCPNCHAMLHRKSPPYSIEELRTIREHESNRRASDL